MIGPGSDKNDFKLGGGDILNADQDVVVLLKAMTTFEASHDKTRN